MAEYIAWDGSFSMGEGRAIYACPVCGSIVGGPLVLAGEDKPIMVHAECVEGPMGRVNYWRVFVVMAWSLIIVGWLFLAYLKLDG